MRKLKQLPLRSRSAKPPGGNPPTSSTTASAVASGPLSATCTPPLQSPRLLSLPYVSSSRPIWSEALVRVQAAEQWQKYLKILIRRPYLQPQPNRPTDATAPGPSTLECYILAITEILQARADSDARAAKPVAKMVGYIAKVKDFGAAATALNPYAALVWQISTCLSACLQSDGEIRALCVDNLPRVLDLRGRYEFCENDVSGLDILPASRLQLRECLISLYTSILEYQVASLITIYSKMHRFAEAFGTKEDSDINSALSNVDDCKAELHNLMSTVQFQLDVKQNGKLSEIHALLETSIFQLPPKVSNMERIVANSERNEVLKWLSPILYGDAHNERKRRVMAQTCEWLCSHPVFTAWNEPAASGILWLKGYMGTGKSCLVSSVIEKFKPSTFAQGSDQSLVAYFYCDKTSSERQKYSEDATPILSCLAKQLSSCWTAGRLPDFLMSHYEAERQRSSPTADLCVQILSLIIDANRVGGAAIILDGFNECSIDVQQSLVDFLQELRVRVTSPLKILVASRDEGDTGALLNFLNPSIIDVTAHTGKDIEVLISARVNAAAQNVRLCKKYKSSTVDLQQNVIEELRARAGGMFSWIETAFEFLHNSSDVLDMQSRLRRLDQLTNLFDLYEVRWRENLKRLTAITQEALMAVLRLVLYDGDYDINADAYAFAVRGTLENGFKYDLEDIAGMCPGFLICSTKQLRKGDLVLYEQCSLEIPHGSIVEFLQQKIPNLDRPTSLLTLGKLCLDILKASQLTPSVTSAEDASHTASLMEYAANRWIWFLELARNFASSTQSMGAFLKNHPQFHNVFDELLLGDPQAGITAIWSRHAEQEFVTEPPSTICAIMHLGFGPDYLNAAHISGELGDYKFCFKRDRQATALHWAAAFASAAEVEWLISKGLNVNTTATRLRITPAHALFSNVSSNPATVAQRCRALLEGGADFTIRDASGCMPVVDAVDSGLLNRDTVDVLLQFNVDIFAPMTNIHTNAVDDLLQHAINENRYAAVACLLPYFQSRRTGLPYWQDCLERARRKCDRETLRHLVTHCIFLRQPLTV